MSNLKSKSINAIIWTLIEKFGNQLFSLIIGIILARLLTPADYGLIGMITVFFALAMVFINSGFGAAYIQKKDATQTDASTIFFFNIFISTLFYILLWFSTPLIAQFYNQEQLISLIRVSAIVLIINSFGMMQNTKLAKDVNFKKKSVISIVSTVFSGVLGIMAAFNNFGVWSLVIQQITKDLINVLGLWMFYEWRPKMVFNINSLKIMFSFGFWILMSSLLKTIFDNIYILTIGKFYPVAQLGFYTKAKGYQTLASTQFTVAISAVSFPVFSKLQNDKIALKGSAKKFMKHTLFFVVLICSVLFVIANPLIEVVLTKKWMPMVLFFQILLIIGMTFPIQNMNISLLNAQGKSKLIFRVSLFKNLLRLINIIIFYRFGIIYIIYGELVISVLILLIVGYFTKITINYGMIDQFKDVYKIFLAALISILVGVYINYMIENLILQIIIGAILVGSIYLGFQYFLNKKLLDDNIHLIKSNVLKYKR